MLEMAKAFSSNDQQETNIIGNFFPCVLILKETLHKT